MLETVRINKMLSEGLTLQHSVSSYSLSFLHSANISFKYLKDDFFSPRRQSLRFLRHCHIKVGIGGGADLIQMPHMRLRTCQRIKLVKINGEG